MIFLRLGIRNLFRHKSRSIISGISLAGTYVLLAFSISLTDGSYSNIIKMMTYEHSGHMQVHSPGYLARPQIHNYLPTAQAEELEGVLDKWPSALAYSPRVYSAGIAFNDQLTTISYIEGVDFEREARVSGLYEKVKQGQVPTGSDGSQVVVGGGLARRLQLKLADEIALISEAADGSFANELFLVQGIIPTKSGEESDRKIYMDITKAQEFLALPGLHEFAIRLEDYKGAQGAATQLRQRLDSDEFDVQPWQVTQKNFYQAMEADKRGNWVTMGIIMFMVALVVLNTVLMNIMDRRREYGVLKAIGTPPRLIFVSVMVESFFLALFSSLAGGLISLPLVQYFSVHGIELEQPIEYGGIQFGVMLAEMTTNVFLFPALLCLTTAFFVALWPALKAARILPVQALARHLP